MKIYGVFTNIERASEVLNNLKKDGFNNSFIQLSTYNGNIQRNLADPESGRRLSNLTLESKEFIESPLTAISPIVNPMGGFTEFRDSNYRIVVETPNNNASKVEDIITNGGGRVEKTAVKMGGFMEDIRTLNKRLKDIDI